ncbi:MAG: hypothetical protein K9K64_10975 [Desulfohalobiaceae bacterium]|nr:hypothetical protein [Desulfohalobiaceae bacterium]
MIKKKKLQKMTMKFCKSSHLSVILSESASEESLLFAGLTVFEKLMKFRSQQKLGRLPGGSTKFVDLEKSNIYTMLIGKSRRQTLFARFFGFPGRGFVSVPGDGQAQPLAVLDV